MRCDFWRRVHAGTLATISLMMASTYGARVSSTRTGVHEAGDSGHSRCCCRGPNLEACEVLQDDQLVDSYRFWEGKVCPSTHGYHHYDKYFSELPSRCSTPSQQSSGERRNVTVKAYWMRHGWSCANALKRQGTAASQIEDTWARLEAHISARKFFLYADPPLTDAAILRANSLGHEIRQRICGENNGQTPLVFSSSLVRSMETAMWNFPEWKVRPIPYIAENNPMPDNTPLSWEEQMADRLNRNPNSAQMLQNIEHDVNPSDHADRSSSLKSSYKHFKQYFPGMLGTLLTTHSFDLSQEIPVIIVGHSGYMKEHLDCKGLDENNGKPRNNEVWVQRYTFELGAYDATLQHVDCHPLLDEYFFPPEPVILCENDVERCGNGDDAKRMPHSWLGQHEEECGTDLGNNILERDIRRNANYTKVSTLGAPSACSK